MRQALLLMAAISLFAQKDTIPEGSISGVKPMPQSMKPGDRACMSGAAASWEHQVWIEAGHWLSLNKRGDCGLLQTVTKTSQGWRVELNGISLDLERHDSDYQKLGYIRATEVLP